MNLVTPELGLIFWQIVVFVTVLFILSRYAWSPITTALKDREKSITEALSKAEEAKKEMLKLQSDNQKLLDDARLERDNMLKSAQKTANDMIEQAKSRAEVEYTKKLDEARRTIDNEKQAALTQIKKQIAELSIDVARTLLKRELENPDKQAQLAADLVKDLKVN